MSNGLEVYEKKNRGMPASAEDGMGSQSTPSGSGSGHNVETTQADGRGIDSLPDELIVPIVELAVSGLQDVFRLSRISAQFRSLILSTPSIWANGCKLTLRSTSKQIRTILKYSGEMALKAHIEANLPYYPVNVLGILHNSERIDEMHISPVNNLILQDYFEGMVLPKLRRLSLRTSVYFPKGYLHKGVEHVYETWDMPQLRCVDANFVPRPMRSNALTSCSLVLHESPTCTSELLGFLNSCRSLRFLSLSFPETVVYHNDASEVEVPFLRSFTIRTLETTASSFAGRILERLSCPLLSEMNVFIKKKGGVIEPDEAETDENTDRTEASRVCEAIEGVVDAVRVFVDRNTNLSKFNVRIEIPRVCGDGERIQSYANEQLNVKLNRFPSRLESIVKVSANGIEVRWDTRIP